MKPTTLESRLASLEKRSRRSGVALLAAVVVMTLSAFAPHDDETLKAGTIVPIDAETLRARKIELVDAEGRVRAELAIDEDGSAGLFLHDEEGRVRASLAHDESQTALYLRDAEGGIRVGAAQYSHGGGGFALHGPGAKGTAVLYLKDEGSLTFYDGAGEVIHRIPQ